MSQTASDQVFAPTPYLSFKDAGADVKDVKKSKNIRRMARIFNVPIMDTRASDNKYHEILLHSVVFPYNLGRFVLWNVSLKELTNWLQLHPACHQALVQYVAAVQQFGSDDVRLMAKMLGKRKSDADWVADTFDIMRLKWDDQQREFCVDPEDVAEVKQTRYTEYLMMRHNNNLLKEDHYGRDKMFYNVTLKMELCLAMYCLLVPDSDHNMLLDALRDIFSASNEHRAKVGAPNLTKEFYYANEDKFRAALVYKLGQQKCLAKEILNKLNNLDQDDKDHSIMRQMVSHGMASPHYPDDPMHKETDVQKVFKLLNNHSYLCQEFGSAKHILAVEYKDFTYYEGKYKLKTLDDSVFFSTLESIYTTLDAHSNRTFVLEDLLYNKWWSSKSELEPTANRHRYDVAYDLNYNLVKIFFKLNNFPMLYSREVMTLLVYFSTFVTKLTKSMAQHPNMLVHPNPKKKPPPTANNSDLDEPDMQRTPQSTKTPVPVSTPQQTKSSTNAAPTPQQVKAAPTPQQTKVSVPSTTPQQVKAAPTPQQVKAAPTPQPVKAAPTPQQTKTPQQQTKTPQQQTKTPQQQAKTEAKPDKTNNPAVATKKRTAAKRDEDDEDFDLRLGKLNDIDNDSDLEKEFEEDLKNLEFYTNMRSPANK